jgi:hypothetical protein
MAQRARLKEGLLAVKRRRPRSVTGFRIHKGICVALQAKQVDVAHPEHVNIRAAMRNMTGRATLDLYGFVFEHKRPLLIGVARETNRVLCCGGSHLLGADGAVRIVTIRALHQSFVNTMAERHFKLGLLLKMARVTQLRLRFRQQKLFGLRHVRRMAGDATDIVLRVDRVDRVHVLRPAGVTTHATGVDFLGRSILERENFGLVATAVNVRFPGTVASFAALPLRSFLAVKCRYKVCRSLEMVEKVLRGHICVTRLASLRSDVERRIARRDILLRRSGRLGFVFSGIGIRWPGTYGQDGTTHTE